MEHQRNYDGIEHKNQILKIKRFAVFKNHKSLLSACGI